MSLSVAQRAPKSSLAIPIVLGIILVPLSQIALGYFSGQRGLSPVLWAVGTPVAYFLVGGLGAFAAVSGLVPAKARRRGSFVGLMAGIGGACSSVVILAAIVAWTIFVPPQSQSSIHIYTGVMPRLFTFGMTLPGSPQVWLVMALFFFVPLFVGVNVIGVGLSPLGGMFSGYLRARMARRNLPAQERSGEQRPEDSREGKLVVVAMIVAILGIITVAAAISWAVGSITAVAR